MQEACWEEWRDAKLFRNIQVLSAQESNKTFYSLDYTGLNFILLDFWWSSVFSILDIV